LKILHFLKESTVGVDYWIAVPVYKAKLIEKFIILLESDRNYEEGSSDGNT
jgi:hypothetical protein